MFLAWHKLLKTSLGMEKEWDPFRFCHEEEHSKNGQFFFFSENEAKWEANMITAYRSILDKTKDQQRTFLIILKNKYSFLPIQIMHGKNNLHLEYSFIASLK